MATRYLLSVPEALVGCNISTAGSDRESAVASKGMAVRTEEMDEFPGDEEGADSSP